MMMIQKSSFVPVFILLSSFVTSNADATSLFSPLNDLFSSFPTNGPLEDVTCNVEDLEQANDSQLHVILQEIKATAFFRNFVVDLSAKCPLEANNDNDDDDDDEEEEFKCASQPEDDEDGPALCQVDDGGFAGAFGGAFAPTPATTTTTTTTTTGSDPNADPFHSNALFSISKEGYQSKEQKDAFAWKQQTDMVVVDDPSPEDDCNDDPLPDEFWMDICSNIQAGDGTSVVNLEKNPERNTAYNGTHIWNAIYEENCIFAESEHARVLDKDTPHNGMCLEERVFYRLLSGLHTSTTLSIAMNYYPPSKRKGRDNWEPNPDYFMKKFQSNPQHIRNLHFSYVVLLRALHKAGPYLKEYEIRTGDIVEDETATILLNRLLDSAILKTCRNVFSAFDESLMFQQDDTHAVSLQKNFKGVFHNISAILDCVQCQQCKLHGKMSMLGYGTALKILFMEQQAALTRNELVALIQTLVKLSESVRHVRELTHLYWQQEDTKLRLAVGALPGGVAATAAAGVTTTTTPPTTTGASPPPTSTTTTASSSTSTSTTSTETNANTVTNSVDLVDATVGSIAALGQEGQIGWEREAELVQLALERHPELLILAKHYGTSTKFLELSKTIGATAAATVEPDAIVVGSGLAGLAAALNILDRGGTVVIVEKEHLLGGNSNKASSGINACCPDDDDNDDDEDTTTTTTTTTPRGQDSLDTFRNDTTRSAGSAARPDLIETLVTKSGDAVMWLKERVGVDLSLKAQLGGHSTKRTHRPSNGMVGAEIIYGMQKAVKSYQKSGQVKILVDTKVQKLVTEQEGSVVVGVEYITLNRDGTEGPVETVRSPNVILATGGFASDRSSGSYLEKHRPELLQMPTTAGAFSTGDGITLATSLGAGTVDMDKVQVHPTGWVDPADPENTSKTLAAELMRGVGGLLIDNEGKRFCNELGTRAYVTKQMLAHDAEFAKTGKWNANATVPTFSLVLSSSAAKDAQKHVDLYSHKGLLTRLEGVNALAKWMGLSKTTVVKTLREYQSSAAKGMDKFKKSTFRGVPAKDLEKEVFYAGTITPVLHYCMGGITIDTEGYVLDENGNRIKGLHAAGEVTGGVHGVNRLAGNSLLECTVYGTIVGKRIPIQERSRPQTSTSSNNDEQTSSTDSDRPIPISELEEHNTDDDCWVAIHGIVYDLTEFAEEHPAGPGSIFDLAGKDGTEAFAAVHNENILEEFAEDKKGVLKA